MRKTPGTTPGLMLGMAWLITACTSIPSQPGARAVAAPDPVASPPISLSSPPSTAPLSLPAHAASSPDWRKPAAEPQPSTTQALPAPALELQGQLSIKLQAFRNMPAKGISLGFFFSGRPEAGRLELMTPLGSQMAQVGWAPTGAWLKRDGGQTTATASVQPDEGLERYDSIDELSERLLGEALPLQTLMHWLQGHPAPEHASAVGPDAGLAEGTFTQDGWLIDTRESPHRLEAVREPSEQLRGIRLKVYLDH